MSTTCNPVPSSLGAAPVSGSVRTPFDLHTTVHGTYDYHSILTVPFVSSIDFVGFPAAAMLDIDIVRLCSGGWWSTLSVVWGYQLRASNVCGRR